MQLTGNYKLKKPEGTDIININDLNENADIIDAKLKQLENHTTSTDGSVHDIQAKIDAHALDKNNPHNITKSQLGLSNILQADASSDLIMYVRGAESLMPSPINTGDTAQITFPVGTRRVSFHWLGTLLANSATTARVDLLLDGVVIATQSFSDGGAGGSGKMFDEATELISTTPGAHTLSVRDSSSGGSASAMCDGIGQLGIGIRILE